MQHRYLLIVEKAPVEVGRTYPRLPSHLTLVSRFFSELTPAQLDASLRPLFRQTKPLTLVIGEPAQLGPKKLAVYIVGRSTEIRTLHNRLLSLLNSLHVQYEYPQFTGAGHKPHITKRPGVMYETGQTFQAGHVCLIEVINCQRLVRLKYALGEV